MDDAAANSPIAGAGELDPGLIVEETGAVPVNRAVFGRQGADILRKQVDGAVDVVEHRPGDLTRQHGEHVSESNRDLQCGPELNPKP